MGHSNYKNRKVVACLKPIFINYSVNGKLLTCFSTTIKRFKRIQMFTIYTIHFNTLHKLSLSILFPPFFSRSQKTVKFKVPPTRLLNQLPDLQTFDSQTFHHTGTSPSSSPYQLPIYQLPIATFITTPISYQLPNQLLVITN